MGLTECLHTTDLAFFLFQQDILLRYDKGRTKVLICSNNNLFCKERSRLVCNERSKLLHLPIPSQLRLFPLRQYLGEKIKGGLGWKLDDKVEKKKTEQFTTN